MMRRDSYDDMDIQLQKLKQSVLDTSQHKQPQKKQTSNFHKLQQIMRNNKSKSFNDPNKQIDVLEGGEYLKLLCHQKKYLSKKRADKVYELNQSLRLEQEDFKYLFMIVTQAHYFKLQHPMYYDRLLEQASNYPKSMFSSIEKDVFRTLLNGHPFQSGLRNVLIAFAVRNPNLLYCQGMNYLVAYFLINSVSEEQAFWILVCLVQNILPDDYFKDLSTISIATQIFSDVIPYIFPEMAKEMKQIGMDSSLFIVSWYVCLFTKGFINSVSAYLHTRFILERRNHSMGFILLKFSLGIIAAILGRDEPFTYKPQFAAFRDKFETSVFQISLLQIKFGLEYVKLNEQNYLKLQKYYREKREERHIETLQKDLKQKRFLLPVCNPNFPICLHRMEIERKIGNVEQVIINRTGLEIKSQYIEDYFDHEPKKESACQDYRSIEECLLYRQNHVCQLDLLDQTSINLKNSLTNKVALRHDESFEMRMIAKNQLIQQQKCQYSIQIIRSFSNADQKFRQLSGEYFVVDENFNPYSDEDIEQISFEEQQKELQKMRHQVSASGTNISIDEPLNLGLKLQRYQLKKDWIKSQITEEIEQNLIQEEDQSYPDMQLEKKEQDHFEKDQNISSKQISKENSNNLQKPIKTNESIDIQESQNNFFSRLQIWNFLGKTWRKIAKIKDQQLQN